MKQRMEFSVTMYKVLLYIKQKKTKQLTIDFDTIIKFWVKFNKMEHK